jgi:hypothetical protein
VGGQVVEDHVDVLACVRSYRSLEKGEELCAVAGRVALAVGLTGTDVPGREQVRGIDRQQRLGPVQGLNLGLLVDGQHHRRSGRVQVQTDNVGDLLGESGIAAEFERALPVRFQPVSRHNLAT